MSIPNRRSRSTLSVNHSSIVVGNLSHRTMCKVQMVSDLEKSGLKDIQDERKFRIKKVCEMCRRHGNSSSNECYHLALNGDHRRYADYRRKFYNNLLVDDKHKVRNCRSNACMRARF